MEVIFYEEMISESEPFLKSWGKFLPIFRKLDYSELMNVSLLSSDKKRNI